MNLEATLTKREDQIAGLIAIAKPKKIIASELYISEHTVNQTARNIFEKTEVHSSTELSIWWIAKKFNLSLYEIYNAALCVVFIFLVGVSEFKSPNYRDIKCRSIVRTIKRKSLTA